jgi:hypothetical protein
VPVVSESEGGLPGAWAEGGARVTFWEKVRMAAVTLFVYVIPTLAFAAVVAGWTAFVFGWNP